jgi:threonine/homoserine/homoserine lactone efflux protein
MNSLALASSPASLFATVALAHALAVMSPGPDFAIVTRQTLAHGRAAGVRTALGIATGICIHVAYALFGLSWAIHEIPSLLTVLRWSGGALLLWIGWNALRAQPSVASSATVPATRAAARDFGVGFATNVLNVKAMLFFVALCSVVVTGATPATLKLALGAWMVVATGLWFCFVAWTLGHPRIRERLFAFGYWIDRIMGAILLLLGAGMLLSELSR